jgi:hypothetical protein
MRKIPLPRLASSLSARDLILGESADEIVKLAKRMFLNSERLVGGNLEWCCTEGKAS